MSDPIANLTWLKWLCGITVAGSLVLLVLSSVFLWQTSKLRSDVQELECRWQEIERDLKAIWPAGRN